jgi:hypothetical protein
MIFFLANGYVAQLLRVHQGLRLRVALQKGHIQISRSSGRCQDCHHTMDRSTHDALFCLSLLASPRPGATGPLDLWERRLGGPFASAGVVVGATSLVENGSVAATGREDEEKRERDGGPSPLPAERLVLLVTRLFSAKLAQ